MEVQTITTDKHSFGLLFILIQTNVPQNPTKALIVLKHIMIFALTSITKTLTQILITIMSSTTVKVTVMVIIRWRSSTLLLPKRL